jgi:hypothetical protein
MSRNKCPKCGNQVDAAIAQCPLCGAALSAQDRMLDVDERRAINWLNLSLLAIVVSFPFMGVGWGTRLHHWRWMTLLMVAGLIGALLARRSLLRVREASARREAAPPQTPKR